MSTPSPADDELWFRVAAALRSQVSEAVWHSTFAEIRPAASQTGELVLTVTNSLARERIEDRYRSMVEAAVRDSGSTVAVRLIVDEPDSGPSIEHDMVDPSSLIAEQVPDDHRDEIPRHAPEPPSQSSHGDSLSERYTFESFVTGTSNRFAHAAALAVAETPGRSYNPLFIHGGAGLGKTHLLQAIVHYIRRNYPGHRVRYVSTEAFMNEFIEAIRTTGQAAFKRRYREVDVLLVDDIQFMEGKEGLQEEFFHTFNSLHGAGRQVVLSSDRPPRSIATLEDRLRSRFEWGLITDIQPPDLETRLAILRKKTEVEGSPVPDEVLEFIATNIKNNIRELEGALIRVAAFASLTHEPLDIDLATRVLADIVTDGEPRPITIDRIIEATVVMFGFGRDELLGKRRHRALVTARQICMYVCRELTDLSYPSIAREFGNRDHTTVIHAVDKISKQMAERRQIYDQVTALIQDIKSQ